MISYRENYALLLIVTACPREGDEGTIETVNRVFQSNPDYIHREVAGEHILVPTGQAAATFSGLASLNGSAAFLWEMLQKPRSEKELQCALAEEYELSEAQSLADLNDFLQLALDHNLIAAIEA